MRGFAAICHKLYKNVCQFKNPIFLIRKIIIISIIRERKGVVHEGVHSKSDLSISGIIRERKGVVHKGVHSEIHSSE
jgi:hypothetical protein